MIIYTLHRKQFLPISVEEAWAFFSSPLNLPQITPPYMNFKIVSNFKKDETIKEGTVIEYRVSPLFKIPLKWITIISKAEAPYCFIDKQEKGPYSFWEHTHTFKEAPGGIVMTDEVNYSLPFGRLGILAHNLIVKKQLEHVFEYRKEILKGLLKK